MLPHDLVATQPHPSVPQGAHWLIRLKHSLLIMLSRLNLASTSQNTDIASAEKIASTCTRPKTWRCAMPSSKAAALRILVCCVTSLPTRFYPFAITFCNRTVWTRSALTLIANTPRMRKYALNSNMATAVSIVTAKISIHSCAPSFTLRKELCAPTKHVALTNILQTLVKQSIRLITPSLAKDRDRLRKSLASTFNVVSALAAKAASIHTISRSKRSPKPPSYQPLPFHRVVQAV